MAATGNDPWRCPYNEQPQRFELDEELYEIAAIEDQWRSPRGSFFKVRTIEGTIYLLAYNEHANQWTLEMCRGELKRVVRIRLIQG